MTFVDLAIKWAIIAGFGVLATRRVTPANAAMAHRVWLLVLLAPIWWQAGEWFVEPVLFARVRRSALPEGLANPDPGMLRIALTTYVTIASLLLLRVGGGIWAVRRLVQGAILPADADRAAFRDIIGDAARSVRESGLPVPVTAGACSPVILLPAGWRAMPRDSLAAILRHEAAHVRRRDGAVAVAAALIQAIFCFHPAAWLAANRVRWFAEMACDAEAARAMDDRRYASALLSLAVEWSDARRPRYTLTAGAETNVGRRIQLLLDESDCGGRRSVRLAVAALLLLAAVPVSSLIDAGAVSNGGAVGSHLANHASHQHRSHH